MKTNTGRMVKLAVENSKMFEGLDFTHHKALNDILSDPKRAVYFLYPSDGSIRIDNPKERNNLINSWECEKKLPTFVIIDGTWANAKKILRLNPQFEKFPFISFIPETGSNFRIRKQPQDLCYSTIETTHYLMSLFSSFNKKEDLESLLVPFNYMVEMQIKYEQDNRRRLNFIKS